MTKTFSLLTLLILSLLPLACANRSLTQPVSPAFAATPTPSWNAGSNYPTPTATP